MNTVGIFAGRGDVIIAIVLAILIGIYIGNKLTKLISWFKEKIK